MTVFDHRQSYYGAAENSPPGDRPASAAGILLSQSKEIEMRLPSTVPHRVLRARLRTPTRNWQPAMCLGLQLAAMTCRWIHLCRCAHGNSVDVTLVKRVQQYQPSVTPSKARCMRRRLIRTTPNAALLDLWGCYHHPHERRAHALHQDLRSEEVIAGGVELCMRAAPGHAGWPCAAAEHMSAWPSESASRSLIALVHQQLLDHRYYQETLIFLC